MNREGVILIVDDEASARDTLEAFLFPEGYTLAFARNGAEALALATELMPDLILLDVMMPDTNGFEVCQRLRADMKLNVVHIVMVTALDDRRSRLRGLEVGADEFLSKPFDSAELLARVRTIMQLNRYRRLLTEQARFSWVVEQTQDGYLMLDVDGNVQYANPQARRLLEMSEMLVELSPAFLPWVERFYRLEPPAAWQNWPQPLSEQAEPRYMVRPESSLTPAVWLHVNLVEMAAAEPVRYLVQLRDATEEILTRSRVWAFDTHISHKIKTPLGQLTGTLQLLDFDFDNLSREEIRDEIAEACQSALRLKERILSIFQYIDVLDARQAWHDLGRVQDIAGLVDEIKSELELNNVRLAMQGIQDQSAPLKLTRPAVKLILWELCQNAQKFHPTHTPTIVVTVTAVQEGVQVSVADNGLGLPYDELGKIWLPYYQIEKTVTGEVPGMGLGLAVVASLITNVGGSYRAYNGADRSGLTVELTIPWTQREDG